MSEYSINPQARTVTIRGIKHYGGDAVRALLSEHAAASRAKDKDLADRVWGAVRRFCYIEAKNDNPS
jgi:hypothetical protein